MNHSVFLGESPGGDDDSPRHLETLTSNSGSSFQPLSSFTPTTTYYTTSSTYFGNELTSHHNLQTVRLPSIASSLSGVGDLSSSIIKEHPAAVQADQMNSYMEYFVEQTDSGQVVHDSNVGEEVIVDGIDGELMDDDQLLEDKHLDDEGFGRYAHMAAHSSRSTRRCTMNKRKQQQIPMDPDADIDLDDLLRNSNDPTTRSLSPDTEHSAKFRSDVSRERRAAAARNRYQRMSEQERKIYNQRRRLKALGIDPNTMQDGASQDQIKETIRAANAKKAEAARLRYHRMTPEEKREYNARRTESFRKRREEEEILLSTPAGCISADALQRAQQIMVRNARKAESARLRYQRMTPAQRKDYNIRRAQSKKTRSKSDTRENSVSGSSIGNDSFSDPANLSLNTSFSSEPLVNILEGGRTEHALAPQKDPTDEIFQQMEREVIKKTKQAKMVLERRHPSHPEPSSRFQEIPPEHVMLNEVATDRSYQQQNQMMIDEKALHDMLVSGRDANGMAVELRTTDGRKITEESELRELSQGQTIIIAPCSDTIEGKDGLYVHSADGQMHMTGSSNDGYDNRYGRDEYDGSQGMDDNDPNMMTLAQRHAMAKAKRAERARIRYRNMQPELRQAQNARRADLLRKARARDEELVQMAENRDISTLAPDLQRQIQEAQQRRARRAEQARNKYHRMTNEERRQYNAMRDAQRRQRKRQIELSKDHGRESIERPEMDLDHHLNEPSGSNSISPNNETLEEGIIYNDYDMYGDAIHNWDQ